MTVKNAPSSEIAGCLEEARDILRGAITFVGDDVIRNGSADWDVVAADRMLTLIRTALVGRLNLMEKQSESQAYLKISALLMRTMQIQLALKDALLARRDQQVNAAHEAIRGLRELRSLAALAEGAPQQAYKIGFTRVLFSRLEGGVWHVRSAFAGEDHNLAATMVAAGKSNPRRLTNVLPEHEMVRRGTPILVRDAAANPRVYPELNEVTRSAGYVAAPVFSWGQAVGLLHADHHTEIQGVCEFDRGILGAFAEGLGITLERNAMLERLRSMREAAGAYLSTANALADDFTIDVMDLAGVGTPTVETTVEWPLLQEDGPRGGQDPLAELTSREREVLRALATGRTNAQIGASLFVTEGTVKSHVKRILRKIGASNRTEAVAKFHRARLGTGDPSGAAP